MAHHATRFVLLPGILGVKYGSPGLVPGRLRRHHSTVCKQRTHVHRRTTEQEYSENAHTIRCVDPKCARLWTLGTQFCLECGEPMTWRAFADLVQQFPAWTDRPMEIMRRYGLSISLFKYVTSQPIAGFRQFPGASTGPKAAPTPVAAIQPCVAPASSAAATTPTPGLGSAAIAAAPKRRAAAEPMTDARVIKLQRSARANRWTSHTARYRNDGEYRQQCEENGYPEWLRFNNGRWILEDGSESYYYQ